MVLRSQGANLTHSSNTLWLISERKQKQTRETQPNNNTTGNTDSTTCTTRKGWARAPSLWAGMADKVPAAGAGALCPSCSPGTLTSRSPAQAPGSAPRLRDGLKRPAREPREQKPHETSASPQAEAAIVAAVGALGAPPRSAAPPFPHATGAAPPRGPGRRTRADPGADPGPAQAGPLRALSRIWGHTARERGAPGRPLRGPHPGTSERLHAWVSRLFSLGGLSGPECPDGRVPPSRKLPGKVVVGALPGRGVLPGDSKTLGEDAPRWLFRSQECGPGSRERFILP